MTPAPIAHSYLFVPGNRPERFAKACAAGADAVIIDLEDAVPADEKGAARQAVAAWLPQGRPVLVRINAAGSEWFDDDLAICGMPNVVGVVLPKAEQPADIGRLQRAGAGTVLPLIETAHGFANARLLAECAPVQRILFGTIDFRVDVGIEGDDNDHDGDALLMFRSQLVLISKLAGIEPPVDGVTTAMDGGDELIRDTLRARRLGFGGKLCIHPKQVDTVNRCFLPSQDEVAWAERVLAACGAAGGAAVAVDGRMVDRPVMLRAQRIVSEAARRR